MQELTNEFAMTVVRAGSDAPVVVELHGELDLHAAKIVGDRVDDLLASNVPALHVACAGVSFVDSSGLHALLRMSRMAEQRGVGFSVVSMSDRLRELVAITATADLLSTG